MRPSAIIAVLLALLTGPSLLAQDPDTLGIPGPLPVDTAARGIGAPDTVGGVLDTVPPPILPRRPDPAPVGFWNAVWEWEGDGLARFQGASLLELIRAVPGVGITRSGAFGRSAGVGPWGMGGGRTRVFLDGWELDPLVSATPELQQIALVGLEKVRVERRGDELRIELTSLRLPDRSPFSMISAATGDPDLRILRGLYLQPLSTSVLLEAGFDLAERGGGRAAFNRTIAFGRLGYAFSPTEVLQLEIRQREVERPDSVFPEIGSRRELVLRGRSAPIPGLLLDGSAGRVTRTPSAGDPFAEISSTRVALRGLFTAGPFWTEANARLSRSSGLHFPVATSDLSARAGFRPASGVTIEGLVRSRGLAGTRGTELRLGGRIGPLGGTSIFGEVAAGERGVGVLTVDSLGPPESDTSTFRPRVLGFGTATSELASVRLGAEWRRGSAAAGAALLGRGGSRLAPFGLPFDRLVQTLPVGPARGAELFLDLPLFRRDLRFEGHLTGWSETGDRPYLPGVEGRAALEVHGLYYTGNLEPTLRAEVVHRGVSRALEPGGASPVEVAPYTLVNAYVQVRIIDVRAFIRVENAFNLRTASDLPGQRLPGLQLLYGIDWHFLN